MATQRDLIVGGFVARDATSAGQRDAVNDADATSQVVQAPLDGTSGARPLGKEASPGSKSCSRLEALHPELRYRILCSLPDLQTLRSLVRASPIMHAQYRYGRDSILRTNLGRELDGFFIDAYATLMSRPTELGSLRTNDSIASFTHTYDHWLSAQDSRPDLDSIDPEKLRSMSSLHLSVAQPLTHRYCEWALANLGQAISSSRQEETALDETETESDGLDLARSEEIRAFRAIYRYETYLNLFGRNDGKREGGFLEETVNHLYFCPFDPWDVEAIRCIDVFIREKYQGILDRVKDDLYSRNVQFRLEGGAYRYEEAFCLTAEIRGKKQSKNWHPRLG